MAGVSASVSYVTLVSHGRSEDVVVPSGITLAHLLKLRRVPTELIPFTTAGDKLPGALVVGREIRNGTLIVLQPESFSQTSAVVSINEEDSDPRIAFSPMASGVGIVIGLVVCLVGFFTPYTVSTSQSITGAVTMFVLALAYAVRPTYANTVSECLAPLTCAVASGLLSTMSNPYDTGYQSLVSAAAAAAAVSAVRWAVRGRHHYATARVTIDCLVLGIGLALVGLAGILISLDPRIVYVTLFGLAAPILQALPGFSITVPVQDLIDESTIVREASSVRGPATGPSGPITAERAKRLVTAASARITLWIILLCADVIVMMPVILSFATSPSLPTWQRWCAILAIVFTACAFLLVPRTAAALYLRLVPRLSVAVMIVAGAILLRGLPHPMTLAGVIAALALIALAASRSLAKGSRPLPITRMGDILQSLCCNFSLPLSLVGAGIITLVRTGGIA